MDWIGSDPDPDPRNPSGSFWIWISFMDIHFHPFSSIYFKVLSAIPGWFRNHVWASMVVNHDWGSIYALAGIKWSDLVGVVTALLWCPSSSTPHDCEALVHRINKSIVFRNSNESNHRASKCTEPGTNLRSSSSVPGLVVVVSASVNTARTGPEPGPPVATNIDGMLISGGGYA
jgi:hypothetical protein